MRTFFSSCALITARCELTNRDCEVLLLASLRRATRSMCSDSCFHNIFCRLFRFFSACFLFKRTRSAKNRFSSCHARLVPYPGIPKSCIRASTSSSSRFLARFAADESLPPPLSPLPSLPPSEAAATAPALALRCGEPMPPVRARQTAPTLRCRTRRPRSRCCRRTHRWRARRGSAAVRAPLRPRQARWRRRRRRWWW